MGQPPIGPWQARRRRGGRPFHPAMGGGSVGCMNSDRPGAEPPPDLQTQLEAVLHAIWIEEDRWRREERIDLAIRLVRDS